MYILLLALCGFLIACYTYFVEKKIAQTPTYKPVCDINDVVSCTKPMRSQYGSILYVSNALVAMGYYGLIGVLTVLGATKLLFMATAAGVLASLGLAYLLYFKIGALCILCTAMYVINVLLFLLSWRLV